MRKTMLALSIILGVLTTPVWAVDSYKIDSAHTELGFSVQHMMVSNTRGQFNKYDGQIMYDANDLANSSINVTIEVQSIDTRNEKRDEHLRSADFFDAAKFPTITFVSKNITSSEIVGDLTIKGVTKEISIPATISGPVKTPFGATVIGINGSTTINRQDYGVNWNKTLDQGGLAVADEVLINVSVEAIKTEATK